MFINTPKCGFHFSENGIAKMEERYNAKYMGYWCTKNSGGGWNEHPVDVFYVENPDTSKGHTNYFGLFHTQYTLIHDLGWMITNAESAFSEPIMGILCDDGEVIVSRYRHDCVMKGEYMIDGGRDYLRCSAGRLVRVIVLDGKFLFTNVFPSAERTDGLEIN